MGAPFIVVRREWSVYQIEAANEAIGNCGRATLGSLSAGTRLGIAYDAMVQAGQWSGFRLEPLGDDEIDKLAADQLGPMATPASMEWWQKFARAIEEAHGIKVDDIPF